LQLLGAAGVAFVIFVLFTLMLVLIAIERNTRAVAGKPSAERATSPVVAAV
jgi:Na+-transporting methylmalonyl-CoA/oxaloacetate decarboxylase gamma subunit